MLLSNSGRLEERLIDGASTHCWFFTGVRKSTSTVTFEAAASMTNSSDMCIFLEFTQATKELFFVPGKLFHEWSKCKCTQYSSAYCVVDDVSY